MAAYLGDIAEDATIYFHWSTTDKSGASITRATDGDVRVYKDDDDAEEAGGITGTEDFDARTGIHLCKIDTSADAFYTPGHDYTVVLLGAVIDGETVNAVLAYFSIENRFQEVDVVKWRGTQPATLSGGAGSYVQTFMIVANINSISAASIAANAIGASELATNAAQEIADEIFRMTTATIEAAGGGVPDFETLYGIVAALTHKHKRDAGDNNIVIYKADGINILVTIPITKESTLEPIQEITPP